jgi:hypothetical protein
MREEDEPKRHTPGRSQSGSWSGAGNVGVDAYVSVSLSNRLARRTPMFPLERLTRAAFALLSLLATATTVVALPPGLRGEGESDGRTVPVIGKPGVAERMERRSGEGFDASWPDFPSRLAPHLRTSLPAAVRIRLGSAFPVAFAKLDHVDSCRALFGRLGADGAILLRNTQYSDAGDADPCRAGAAAFTYIGSPRTRLCSNFAALEPGRAATILIHEALHYAGLPERPACPTGLDSREINALIQVSCGF